MILKIFEHTDKETLVNSISQVTDDQWLWEKLTMKHFGDLYKAFPKLHTRHYQFDWRLEFEAWFQFTCGQRDSLSRDQWLTNPQTYNRISVTDLISAVKGLSPSGSCLVSLLSKIHKQGTIPTTYNIRRDLISILSEKCKVISVLLAIRDSLDLFEYLVYIYSGKQYSSEFPLDEALSLMLSLTLEQNTSLVNCIRTIRQRLLFSLEFYIDERQHNDSKECKTIYQRSSLEYIVDELLCALDVSNDCEMYCKNEMYGACINAITQIRSLLECYCNTAVQRFLETLL